MLLGEIDKVKNVSAETKNAIIRKSAQSLPTNPSERGYSAEEIKRRFYQPILDAANSALSEIDRVVNEFNNSMGQMEGNFNWLVEKSLIKEPYKLTLNKDNWVLNESSGLYEITIPASTHGIENYDEIGVDMFLLDGQGKYTHVNQFEIKSDASVRIFHENNGAGYISIYIKREGYISSKEVIDAENVLGLSKVGITNNFEDLDNKPNLNIMYSNEEILSKIIGGGQVVNKAVNADKATNADFSSTSGASDYSTKADFADRAKKDASGADIEQVYAKQNGSYDELRAGKAGTADKAIADEDGVNIKNRYAKQDGTYTSMSVGKATNAEQATKADEATRATNDENGNNIVNTYAQKNGTYSNMTAGFAQYASEDTSKGTIEERLTSLGFKEGVAEFSGNAQAYINTSNSYIKLTRQGNYVILKGKLEFLSYNAMFNFFNNKTEIFKLPDNFLPKENTYFFLGSILVAQVRATATDYSTTPVPITTLCILSTDGTAELVPQVAINSNLMRPYSMYLNYQNYEFSVGFEAIQ